MFSHTHKGQTYNAPLLSKFLEEDLINARNGSKPVDDHLLPTLVDWELLTDENGKRTVGFGWYAGGKLFPFHILLIFYPCGGWMC